MASATAAYRLNPEMQELLGTGLLRLIVRGETVIGRYGRHGYVNGALRGRVLTATLRDGVHHAVLHVTFSENYVSFEGFYRPALGGEAQELRCHGTRITRRRS